MSFGRMVVAGTAGGCGGHFLVLCYVVYTSHAVFLGLPVVMWSLDTGVVASMECNLLQVSDQIAKYPRAINKDHLAIGLICHDHLILI